MQIKSKNETALPSEGGRSKGDLVGSNSWYLLWLEETIALLKAKRLHELDLDNLIEELEALRLSEENAVESLLEQIVRHLLLLQYWTEEAEYNKFHWQAEITGFRSQLK